MIKFAQKINKNISREREREHNRDQPIPTIEMD